MVKSHPAHHAMLMQECGSIRIFRVLSSGVSVSPQCHTAAVYASRCTNLG